MGKLKKLVCALFLGLLIIPFISTESYAKEKIEFGSFYEGKEIVGVLQLEGRTYYLDEIELERVKQDSYKDYLKNVYCEEPIVDLPLQSYSNENSIYRNAGAWSILTVKSTSSPYLDYSKKTRVSMEFEGPCSISYGFSKTFTFSANASLDATEKIKVGGVWSAATTETFGVTYSVPEGKIGYVVFTPRYKKIIAERQNYFDATLLSTETITIYQPTKIGSFADGLYALETR